MQSCPPRWSCLVTVCSHSRPADGPKPSCAGQGSAELQRFLKDQLKAEGLWGQVRVVTAGCLDLCSREGVTVAIGSDTRLLVAPEADREALLAQIRAAVTGA